MRFLLIACFALAAHSQTEADKEFRFEVVSFRPMKMEMGVAMSSGPSPAGFDSRMSLWQAIMVAYGPRNPVTWGSMEVLGTPNWIGDFYDIHARVSQADLKAWQSQGKEHELLRAALRAALKDRCQLAVHEQASKGQIFEMVVEKKGPQLKAAVPNSVLPTGVKLTDGGVMVGSQVNNKTVWEWHGASMEDLADFLSGPTRGIPVRDRTGLTGRYDFTIREQESLPDENHVYSWPVGHLGLQLKPGIESRPALVIDHIEKPTPN